MIEFRLLIIGPAKRSLTRKRSHANKARHGRPGMHHKGRLEILHVDT